MITQTQRNELKNQLHQEDKALVDKHLDYLSRNTKNGVTEFNVHFFRFLYFINKTNLLEINKEEVMEFFDDLRIKGKSNATLRTYRKNLYTFFRKYEEKMKVYYTYYKSPVPTLQELELSKPKQRRKKPVLNPKDSQFLERYVKRKASTTDKGAKNTESVLYQFLNFNQKYNLMDVNELDVELYLEEIEDRGLKYSTKNAYRYILYKFFKKFEKSMRKTGKVFFNPVPEWDEWNFSPDPTPSIIKQQRQEEEETYTINELLEILQHSHRYKKKYFIIHLLLTFCGMRISECVSIKIENINLKERYLVTGITKNAMKSNRKGDKPLYFCFPRVLALILYHYIIIIKKRYGEKVVWLFPSRGKHFTEKGYNSWVERIRKKGIFKFMVKSHSFRRTLTTFMANSKNNAPPHIADVLTNHSIRSTTWQHYNKISIEERRTFYDKYFPREYQAIIKWLRKEIL